MILIADHLPPGRVPAFCDTQSSLNDLSLKQICDGLKRTGGGSVQANNDRERVRAPLQGQVMNDAVVGMDPARRGGSALSAQPQSANSEFYEIYETAIEFYVIFIF
jgi:hypothetical protein